MAKFNEDGSIERDYTPSEPEPDPEFSMVGCLYGIALVVVIILIVKILIS